MNGHLNLCKYLIDDFGLSMLINEPNKVNFIWLLNNIIIRLGIIFYQKALKIIMKNLQDTYFWRKEFK